MIGKGIKHFRDLNGLSQRKLAVKLKSNQPHLCAIETGKKKPSMEFLEKIAKVLKIPIPVLFWFGLDENDFKNKMVAKILKPKIDEMMLHLINTKK